jgi:hypothetical protein
MQFVVRGQSFELTPEDVERIMAGVDPQPYARYAVKIGTVWYPPKQVLSIATGLPVAAFTTQDAYRIMARLGFLIIEAKDLEPKPSENTRREG